MQDEEQAIASRVSQGHNSCTANTQDTSNDDTPPPLRTCHAIKCRLLKARAILRYPRYCINNKNMCSGCLNENMQQMHMLQIKSDILHSNESNSLLAPIIQYCNKPTNLRHVRKLFQHLPTFANRRRDDHIYGATRYISNTLGIMLMDGDTNNLIDQPMTNVERRQAWCMATFHCKCTNSSISPKNFTERYYVKHVHVWYVT
jgi:hypothetical protein